MDHSQYDRRYERRCRFGWYVPDPLTTAVFPMHPIAGAMVVLAGFSVQEAVRQAIEAWAGMPSSSLHALSSYCFHGYV